ncbi:C-type mannose receptor 2-like [Thunnus maccoyii]|uniref:C-type mannose receptor 2-like n=1 Tax=Thunnus maccoyii TaxID=8240 RepID=UPI001C4B0289|nr:C-type mannose receptor 2-like [Thunnus maccoyii]
MKCLKFFNSNNAVFSLVLGSLLTCQQYEYHFIEEQKTWYDAQKYCKEKYTDLATVYDMTDMTRLCKSKENQQEAWIGLHNMPGIENTKWHWSLPGVEYNATEAKWCSGEPCCTFHESCVYMISPKNCRRDVPCTLRPIGFICYDEKNSSKKFHLFEEKKTWPEAQSYCRENHTDLVSGLNQLQDEKLKEEIKNTTFKYWVGLFRDNWRWSDESLFSFRHWDHSYFVNQPLEKKCAMTMLNETGRWKTDDCKKTKSFFCYDDKVILINENKTWEEALYYCRENHRDLVSITNLHQQSWVKERAKKADSPYIWLGLRYTCTLDFWFWVSDEVVSYKNWASPLLYNSNQYHQTVGDTKCESMAPNRAAAARGRQWITVLLPVFMCH